MGVVMGSRSVNVKTVRAFGALDEEIPVFEQLKLRIEAAAELIDQTAREQGRNDPDHRMVGILALPVSGTAHDCVVYLMRDHVAVGQQGPTGMLQRIDQIRYMRRLEPVVLVEESDPLTRCRAQAGIACAGSIQRGSGRDDLDVRSMGVYLRIVLRICYDQYDFNVGIGLRGERSERTAEFRASHGADHDRNPARHAQHTFSSKEMKLNDMDPSIVGTGAQVKFAIHRGGRALFTA